MKKYVLMAVMAAMVCLVGCSEKPAAISGLNDNPITFVPVKHEMFSSMSLNGSTDGVAYKCSVDFDKDNNIKVDLFVDPGDDVTYSNVFNYQCTDDQKDKIQVIYGAYLKSEDCPEFVTSDFTAEKIKELHDGMALSLVYTFLCYDIGQPTESEAFLSEAYNDAKLFYSGSGE